MRRLLSLVIVAGLGAVAYGLPEPQPVPVAARPEALVASDSSEAGVWYCPWLQSSFEKDGVVALASVSATSASITLPNPEPGQEADQLAAVVAGPGANSLFLADIGLRGDMPGFVEFDDGPASAAALVESDTTLSADSCVSSGPKVWYLVGGSTLQGETLTLRLFNPFPEVAKVTAAATSEFGVEPLSGYEGFAVAPRSWQDILFHEELRLRAAIAITVTAEEGTVLPALAMSNAEDDAFWTGASLNRSWEFPVVRTAGLDPAIVLFNPGTETAEVQLDIFTAEGPSIDVRSELVAPATPTVVPIGDLADAAIGVKVRADIPIGAAVVARTGGGLTATGGIAAPAQRWLLPGAGTAQQGTTSLWLLNTGQEPATVTLVPLGGADSPAEKVAVPAGTVRQVIVEEGDVEGFLADSLQPFSAAWSVQGAEGSAIASGAPIS